MLGSGVLSLRQLIDKLVRYCKEGESGTIFFNLVTGQSARFVLNKGVICWVAYENLRGEEAIDEIGGILEARFSFNSSLKLVIGQQQLPPTYELLKILYKRSKALTLEHDDIPVVTEMVSPLYYEGSVTEARPFSLDQFRLILEEEAIEFLGPMAKILCADYLKALPNQLSHSEVRDAIVYIMQDINDATKRQQFMTRVKKALNLA
jgi:hypothetical protein